MVRLALSAIGAFSVRPAAPVPLLNVIPFDDAPRLPSARIASVPELRVTVPLNVLAVLVKRKRAGSGAARIQVSGRMVPSRIVLMMSVPVLLIWIAALLRSPARAYRWRPLIPSPVRLYPDVLNVRVPTSVPPAGAPICTTPPSPVNTAVSGVATWNVRPGRQRVVSSVPPQQRTRIPGSIAAQANAGGGIVACQIAVCVPMIRSRIGQVRCADGQDRRKGSQDESRLINCEERRRRLEALRGGIDIGRGRRDRDEKRGTDLETRESCIPPVAIFPTFARVKLFSPG